MTTSESTSTKKSKNTSTPIEGSSLKARLSRTSAAKIEAGVKKTERFTKADEDHEHRTQRVKDGKTVGRIRRCAYWVFFAMAVAFLLHTAWLFAGWVENFSSDSVKVESYIFRILDYVLIILATLFVEGMVRGKSR